MRISFPPAGKRQLTKGNRFAFYAKTHNITFNTVLEYWYTIVLVKRHQMMISRTLAEESLPASTRGGSVSISEQD